MPKITKTSLESNKKPALKPEAKPLVKMAAVKPPLRAGKATATTATEPATSPSLETKQKVELKQELEAGAAIYVAAESESPSLLGQVALPGKEPDQAISSAAGLTPELVTEDDLPAAAQPEKTTSARSSKKNVLIGLLQRPEGATIDQLVKELTWLPHTVRAALTGLRKSGYSVGRKATPEGSGSTYLISRNADALPQQSS